MKRESQEKYLCFGAKSLLYAPFGSLAQLVEQLAFNQ